MAVTVIKNYTRRVVETKKSRIGLIVGVALLLGGIGYVLYLRNKNKPAENSSDNDALGNEDIAKDANVGIKTKEGTQIIVKDNKPKTQISSEKPKAISFPVNTKITVKPPMTKSIAYDRFFKKLGDFNKAVFKGDFNDKYIIGEINVAKGLGFETKTVYLLKKDWIKS